MPSNYTFPFQTLRTWRIDSTHDLGVIDCFCDVSCWLVHRALIALCRRSKHWRVHGRCYGLNLRINQLLLSLTRGSSTDIVPNKGEAVLRLHQASQSLKLQSPRYGRVVGIVALESRSVFTLAAESNARESTPAPDHK